MDTKVKVSSTVLLAALKAHKEGLVREHTAKEKAYKEDLKAWEAEVKEALKQAPRTPLARLSYARTHSYDEGYRPVVQFEIPREKPAEVKPLQTNRLDSEIRVLSLAPEQTITLNSDDSRVQYLTEVSK